MDRADLAVEVRGEALEEGVRDLEHMPEATDGIAVVAAMNRVDVTADGICNLHGIEWISTKTPSEDSVLVNSSKNRATETGRGNPPDFSVARTADQFVRHEIEFDIQQFPAICRHRRCSEPARREIQRDIPSMVLYRRKCQTGLADDLHIHMQCFTGVLPLFPLE
jgi:hypothetical protein